LRERRTGILKNSQRPWKDRDHALFVGYAPAHDPQYAISVVIEHGGGGSKAAAPVARDVMVEALKRRQAADRMKTEEAKAANSDAGHRKAALAGGADGDGGR
jgi:penicillin-binding protein 2